MAVGGPPVGMRVPDFDSYRNRTGLTSHPGQRSFPNGWSVSAAIGDLRWTDDPNGWFGIWNQVLIDIHAPSSYSGGPPTVDFAFNSAVTMEMFSRNGSPMSPYLGLGDDISIGSTSLVSHNLGGGHWSSYDPSEMWGGSNASSNYYVDMTHAMANSGLDPKRAGGSNAFGDWPNLNFPGSDPDFPTFPVYRGDQFMNFRQPYKAGDFFMYYVGTFFLITVGVRIDSPNTTYENFPNSEVVAYTNCYLGEPQSLNGDYGDARRNLKGVVYPKDFVRW